MAEIQQDTLGSTEDTLRFLDMVGLFGTQAMIALGKLANPATGKADKNMACLLYTSMASMRAATPPAIRAFSRSAPAPIPTNATRRLRRSASRSNC